MRYETGTFELRDNDTIVRELSSNETNEVAGGQGTALLQLVAQSGTGSTLNISDAFVVASSNTAAAAAISASVAATGSNNHIAIAMQTAVGPPF